MLGDNGEIRKIQGQYIVEGVRSTEAGSGGHDLMEGGLGNDILMGGSGDDLLVGGEGEDYLWGDGGSDILWSGYEGYNWTLFRVLDGETRADKFEQAPGVAEAEALNPTGYAAPLITPKVLNGQSWQGSITDGNDVLRGGYGDDILFGGGGDDDLDGASGNDYIDGGLGIDTATGGGGDDVVRGGAGDDNLRGDFPFIGKYDSVDPVLRVGDTGTPGDPMEYFYYRGFYTGRDIVYGEEGSERLFGDGGASDVITFSDASVFETTTAKAINPALNYPAAQFDFDGANNDIEFRAVVPDTGFLDWTITITDRGADGLGVQASFDTTAKTMNVSIEKGITNAAEVQEAVYDTPNAPFLVYHTYRGANALPYADYADGPGAQIGQRLWGGAGDDFLYAWAPLDDAEQYLYSGDDLRGGPGNDFLYGNIRQDRLFGDTGNDNLFGDWLVGPTYGENQRGEGFGPAEIGGDDLLNGGTGQDRLLGGGGNDTLWVARIATGSKDKMEWIPFMAVPALIRLFLTCATSTMYSEIS